MKIYFTYASNKELSGMPFSGGWTVVEADSTDRAVELFKKAHPNPENENIVNCSFIYDEEYFDHIKMKEKGNFGAFCHETIIDEKEADN